MKTNAIAGWVCLVLAARTGAAEPAVLDKTLTANQWVKLDKAELKRVDAPLVYEPTLKRFMVLGGSISWPEYPKTHPFDEVALDAARGQWENWIPAGKEWGPQFGDCKAPGWKSEYWGLADTEGNCRPNLTRYTGVKYSGYALDPDSKRVYFYAQGSTLCYDPAGRAWKDLAPANHPGKAGGTLFWSSMCYVPDIKKVLLFGGGNVQTERGDPGTWTYDPAVNVWEELKLNKQPPQRTASPMVYDPVHRKVVLFGGDQLNQLLNDTWTFDGQKWEERKPALAPAPRGGHAMVWLAGAKKVLMLGGWSYESGGGYYPGMYRNRPLEAWTYDTAKDKWEFIASWEKNGPPSSTAGLGAYPIRAAAGEGDTVVVLSGGTWLGKLDASRADAAGGEKLGAKPGSVERRKETYDPEWYHVPAPSTPAEVEAQLKAIPANVWTPRPAPRQPKAACGWGTAVFAPNLDLIMRFSGGHCYYSGTAPQVYDVKTGRWSIPFAPEMPLEFCTSNDQVPGEWSFTGSPWISGHTYKTTGYEPESKTLVFAGRAYTYFFDPVKGKWARADKPSPFRTNMHVTTLSTTPRGVVAWAEDAPAQTGMFLLDAKARTWSKLPLAGKLPAVQADQHGMAYDSKRDRLLLFSSVDKKAGDVLAYDLKSGEAKWLDAAGQGRAKAPSREATYLADLDVVLLGARSGGESKGWLVYDCDKNAWLGADIAGSEWYGKGGFNVDLGLMYDPNRKLAWAVDLTNKVYVLKLDPKAAQKLD